MKKSLFLIPLLLVVAFLLPLTDCTHHSSGGSYDLLYSDLDPNVKYYTVSEAVEYIKSLDKEKDETYEIHVKDDTETSCESLHEALESLNSTSVNEILDRKDIKGPRIILDIKNTILDIGDYAFSIYTSSTSDLTWKYALKEIVLPKNCTEIGEWAFRAHAGLEKVTFPDVLTTIGEYAFHCCYSLEEVDLSNTQVKVLDNDVFNMNITINSNEIRTDTVLKSVKLPDTLETLGKQVFQCCTGLTSINFPKSVRTIGRRVFYCCSNIESITIENDPGKIWGHNIEYSKVDGDNFGELTETATKYNTTLVHCFEENIMYFLADDSIGKEPTLVCKNDCDCNKGEYPCTCEELTREGNPTNSGGHGDKWGCDYWWYRVSEQ